MRMTLVVHIFAGALGLLSGAVALSTAKGARLHRKSGMLFVYAMLTMAVCGTAIAAIRGVAPAVNIPAALMTAYLVITGLITVRPLTSRPRWLDVGLMLVAIVVALVDLNFGFEALANGGKRQGIPAFPFLMFGVVGLLASAGDYRMIRSNGLRGAARLARHLWRMCYALFIAALSFFLGQAKVIPKPVRIPALLALPVLAVLLTMLYWLWRVRIRRSLRGIIFGAAERRAPLARDTAVTTDGVGFEPTVRYERTHTFQACALNHSATRPYTLTSNHTSALDLARVFETPRKPSAESSRTG